MQIPGPRRSLGAQTSVDKLRASCQQSVSARPLSTGKGLEEIWPLKALEREEQAAEDLWRLGDRIQQRPLVSQQSPGGEARPHCWTGLKPAF